LCLCGEGESGKVKGLGTFSRSPLPLLNLCEHLKGLFSGRQATNVYKLEKASQRQTWCQEFQWRSKRSDNIDCRSCHGLTCRLYLEISK